MSDVDLPTSPDASSQPSAARADTPTSMTRRGGAWRALVAGVVSAVMLLAMLGVAVFAQTGQAAAGPTFLPADSVLYAELRLDLPGDQRDDLMEFLGHLPGFADAASFDDKLDETIDQLLGGAEAPISWTEDVKPWFGGQVMLGLTELPPLDMSLSPGSAGEAARSAPLLVGLSATDGAALDATVEKLLAATDDPVTTQDHDGMPISIIETGDGGVTALAPTDTVLLLSNDVALIETALDVLAGATPSLAGDADFQAAVATLPADRLGAFYLDTAQVKDALGPVLARQFVAQPALAASAAQIEAALAMLPPWVTGVVWVGPDNLDVRIEAPIGEGGPSIAIRATDLAARMPADSLLFLETRDLGAAIKGLVGQLKPTLAAQDDKGSLTKIEQFLGTGLESYFDWVGDVAVGASLSTTGLSVGLVASVTDQATAEKRIDSLLTLVRAVSVTEDPSPVAITTQDVDGVTVTTIALTDTSGVPSDLPIDASFSVAVDDGHLYLGLGEFAADALARDPADSLAATPGYTKALAAVGEANGGLVYVDVASALGLAELMMSSDDRATFESQVKPYAEVLDFFVASIGQSETTTSLSLMLFVK